MTNADGVHVTDIKDMPIKFENSHISSETKVPIDKDVFGMSFRSEEVHSGRPNRIFSNSFG